MLGRAVGSFCRMCRTSDRTASLAVSVAARAASPPVWTGEEAGLRSRAHCGGQTCQPGGQRQPLARARVGEGGNGVYRA